MTELNTATFPLYHPAGVRVTFTVSSDLHAVNDAITQALANGYTVNVAGLQAGEYREAVGAIVRYNKKNNDNTVSPRLYFYSDKANLVHKLVDTYLDSPEQIREFEQVSGLSLATVPAWQAKSTPDRKEADEAGVLISVKKAFHVVFKDNPEYKGEGDKENTKYKFVRYEGSAPLAVVPKAPSSSSASSPANPAASVERIEVTGDVSDAIDAAFGKREPNTIVVSEIKVVRSGGNSRMLLFEAGDVTVSAFTRDKLRGVLPDPLLEQIATPGRYAVPSMKITYELDGGHNRLAKAELVA